MKALRFESIRDIKKKVRSCGEERDKAAETLVKSVEEIRDRIETLNANLNEATDPVFIEGCVYELKALHIKHDFFIRQCKEHGLTVDIF